MPPWIAVSLLWRSKNPQPAPRTRNWTRRGSLSASHAETAAASAGLDLADSKTVHWQITYQPLRRPFNQRRLNARSTARLPLLVLRSAPQLGAKSENIPMSRGGHSGGPPCVGGDIWLCGDLRGNRRPLDLALSSASSWPRAILLVGDLDPPEPIGEWLAPVTDLGIQTWFINGNHETDSDAVFVSVFQSAGSETSARLRDS